VDRHGCLRQSVTVLTAPAITTQPVGKTVTYGETVTLNVTATGSGPLAYQWQCNGVDVPGATGSTLTLAGIQTAQAGLYSVTVGNSVGSISSAVAPVNVMPVLATQFARTGMILTWPPPFVLQWATDAAGPYTDVPGATSPYFHSYASGPMRFFRLRPEVLKLNYNRHTDGKFEVSGNAVPGCSFVLQASTNFVNWVNLQTNATSFTIVDEQAPLFRYRFYRGILAQ
jgi:hypothetical protein